MKRRSEQKADERAERRAKTQWVKRQNEAKETKDEKEMEDEDYEGDGGDICSCDANPTRYTSGTNDLTYEQRDKFDAQYGCYTLDYNPIKWPKHWVANYMVEPGKQVKVTKKEYTQFDKMMNYMMDLREQVPGVTKTTVPNVPLNLFEDFKHWLVYRKLHWLDEEI